MIAETLGSSVKRLLLIRNNGIMWICGFVDLWIRGQSVHRSHVDLWILRILVKTWWNWGQNMMKLGPKHGEIHILCRTTFCPSFVPHMRDLRDIFQLSLIMRDIFIQWECFIVVMWLVSLPQDQFKTGIRCWTNIFLGRPYVVRSAPESRNVGWFVGWLVGWSFRTNTF